MPKRDSGASWLGMMLRRDVMTKYKIMPDKTIHIEKSHSREVTLKKRKTEAAHCGYHCFVRPTSPEWKGAKMADYFFVVSF